MRITLVEKQLKARIAAAKADKHPVIGEVDAGRLAQLLHLLPLTGIKSLLLKHW